MRYGSFCSGIEAASLAWTPLGITPAWFAEVEPFCNALLSQRWPGVPNLGDVTRNDFCQRAALCGPIDVLVGGTPCQGFSLAGQQRGLSDGRSCLALDFLRAAETLRPEWLVWENVQGALATNDGRDFGAFVGRVEDIGYGWCYRVLDGQFFGVPQTRSRVFLVGRAGGRSPAAVLLDQGGEGKDSGEGQEPGAHVAPHHREGDGGLTRRAVAFTERGRNNNGTQTEWQEERSYCLRNPGKGGRSTDRQIAVMEVRDGVESYAARRMTPRECERLMGMPDDYTLITYRSKPAADSMRYRAIGNSMAVPVMAWIGRRLLAAAAAG